MRYVRGCKCIFSAILFDQVWMDRKESKKNLLLTHWENATLPHRVGGWRHARIIHNLFQDSYVIEYKRINHYDFKYQLKMGNPKGVKKKVIVRLWLVPSNRTSDGPRASYHPSNGFVLEGNSYNTKLKCPTLTAGPTIQRKPSP